MIPVIPTLTVRRLDEEDAPALLDFLNRRLADTPYTIPFDEETLREQIYRDTPPSRYEVRWVRPLRVGAWRGGELVGFLDAAAGHDSAHPDLPEYEPHGLLRYVGVTEHDDAHPYEAMEVFDRLMALADDFWRGAEAQQVTAFHVSTGYPNVQAGAGLLPGDAADTMRLMTGANWRLSERYYAMVRPLGGFFEEEIPVAHLSVALQRTARARIYQVYHRRVEWVARARMAGMALDRAGTAARVAHLVNLEVSPGWRNRAIGKWLLRRLVNDATVEGHQEMLIYVPLHAAVAVNLFAAHGFAEQNYRGYTLEKVLEPRY